MALFTTIWEIWRQIYFYGDKKSQCGLLEDFARLIDEGGWEF
jgi:hypothetical protein